MGDLVAGRDDLGDASWMALGDPTWNVEGGLYTVPGEEIKDQRYRDLGAVSSLGEHAWAVRVGGVLADPHFLGIEVEGERGGAPRSLRPHTRLDSLRSRRSPQRPPSRSARLRPPTPPPCASNARSARPGPRARRPRRRARTARGS